MTKMTREEEDAYYARVEEMKNLSIEVGKAVGKAGNSVFDAIEGTEPGPALQAIIDKGWETVRQYDRALARHIELGYEPWVASFKDKYEWRVDGIREDLAKLEAKQRDACLPTAKNGHGKAQGEKDLRRGSSICSRAIKE